jgi:hypothetical protein
MLVKLSFSLLGLSSFIPLYIVFLFLLPRKKFTVKGFIRDAVHYLRL